MGNKKNGIGLHPILTKLEDREYNSFIKFRDRMGFGSSYEFLGAFISLFLRYMEDYPNLHDGKEPQDFHDLDDMLETYFKNRVP